MILADTGGERRRPWGSLLDRLSHGTDSESRDLWETQFSLNLWQLSLLETSAVSNSFDKTGPCCTQVLTLIPSCVWCACGQNPSRAPLLRLHDPRISLASMNKSTEAWMPKADKKETTLVIYLRTWSRRIISVQSDS